MLRDTKGNRLYRRIDIKIIFPPDVLPVKKISQRAEAHKGFGPSGIDDILMQVTDQLDTLYPWWQFEMVPLAPSGRTTSFVFKFVGYRLGTSVASMSPEAQLQTVPIDAIDRAVEAKVKELAEANNV